MRRIWLSALLAFGCNTKNDPFKPVPECMGPTVTAFSGDRQLVISQLAIADYGEGFDLDQDGSKDNKLAALGALANKQINSSFVGKTAGHDIVIPFELFGYSGSDTMCTKLSFYVGSFNQDRDGDGKTTTWNKGDCLDTDANVKPGMAEDLTNRLDDDCDGIADDAMAGVKPTDMMDLDGDGVTLAQGDCDDRADTPDHKTLAASRHPGAKDVCDDGIDQDCDGLADNDPSCDPFQMNDATVRPTAPSFQDPNANPPVPLIAFKDGKVKMGQFNAGPDLFQVTIPLQNMNIFIQLSGAHLQMTLADAGGKATASSGLLGGVLEAVSLAGITGINASDVCKKDQSLLDCIFAGSIGTILGLDTDKDGHSLPDIDVDGDGLETFWNSNPPPAGQSVHIDTCKDGDGTIVMGTDCPMAKDKNGKFRFVDGLSMALKFSAVPVKISSTIVAK